jgi:hypothetical protein
MSDQSDFRGVVISPGFLTVLGVLHIRPSELIVPPGRVPDGSIPNLVRWCLLYWDKIEWPLPYTDVAQQAHGYDIEFLIDAGLLQRTPVSIPWRLSFFDSGYAKYLYAQLQAFERLEAAQPGQWSLSQDSETLDFPGAQLPELRSLECSFFRALPVPSHEVSFQDVVEFKLRYASELIRLRMAMDEFYLQVTNSADLPLARVHALNELSKATLDVEKALKGANHLYRRVNYTVEVKPSAALSAAIAAGAIASQIDIPFALGAAVGGVLSTLTFKLADVPTPQMIQAGPFAYVYHVGRELRR